MAAKQKKTRARQPLANAFNSLAHNASKSVAFHEAVLANSSVVRVKYTLTTTPGLAVERVAFGSHAVNLKNDQDPEDRNIFKTRKRKFDEVTCLDDKLMIEVLSDGTDGNGWSLEVTVDEEELPDNPIEQEVNSDGVANHAELHPLP